jgi:hypothetical protein
MSVAFSWITSCTPRSLEHIWGLGSGSPTPLISLGKNRIKTAHFLGFFWEKNFRYFSFLNFFFFYSYVHTMFGSFLPQVTFQKPLITLGDKHSPNFWDSKLTLRMVFGHVAPPSIQEEAIYSHRKEWGQARVKPSSEFLRRVHPWSPPLSRPIHSPFFP